jgi:hypothetical protein
VVAAAWSDKQIRQLRDRIFILSKKITKKSRLPGTLGHFLRSSKRSEASESAQERYFKCLSEGFLEGIGKNLELL